MNDQSALYLCGDTPHEQFITISQIAKHLMNLYDIKPRENALAMHLYPTHMLVNYEAITAWIYDFIESAPNLTLETIQKRLDDDFSVLREAYSELYWSETLLLRTNAGTALNVRSMNG